MQRRWLLRTFGIGLSLGVAGCSSSDSTPPSSPAPSDSTTSSSPAPSDSTTSSLPAPDEFDQCNKLVIRIPTLPSPARQEVKTALNEGQYESESELYLPHVVAISESYLGETEGDSEQDYRTLSNQDVKQYHRALTTQDGGTNRLELEPAIPTRGFQPLQVENKTDEPLTAEISIERLRDSEIVVNETLSIPAGESTETTPFNRFFGSYRANIETDRFSDQGEWSENELHLSASGIVLGLDEITVMPTPTLDPFDCEGVWESAQKE